MKSNMSEPKSVLSMRSEKACEFFLKEESYNNFGLPKYFAFKELLKEVHGYLKEKELSDLIVNKKLLNCDRINYTFFMNKDGKYSWRPLELIHPVLYVALTLIIKENWCEIKERFKSFQENTKIKCYSLPVESGTPERQDKASQISHWWENIEQTSIELSLEFEKVIHTDITNCYGAIYTHAIPWALHTKSVAKEKRGDTSLVGNKIDKSIRDIRNGQSKGIPQGSVLMDFIAEMVLGYADEELTKKIKISNIEDYQILRYRDDYRIFVNSSLDGEKILKLLSEVLVDLGLELNKNKTFSSDDVISSAVKLEKSEWNKIGIGKLAFQKELLLIYDYSRRFPNSGIILTVLINFHNRLLKFKKKIPSSALVSIVTEIAINNPKTYPMCAAILSKLLTFYPNTNDKKQVLEKINKKFLKIPNTEYMNIWLQRIRLPLKFKFSYKNSLCKLANDQQENYKIWDSEWIKCEKLKNILKTSIINRKEIEGLSEIISKEEVELFSNERYY